MKRLLLALLLIPTICLAQDMKDYKPYGIFGYLMAENYPYETWQTRYGVNKNSSNVFSGMIGCNLIQLNQKIGNNNFLGKHRLTIRYLNTVEMADSMMLHREQVEGVEIGLDPILAEFGINIPPFITMDIGYKVKQQEDVSGNMKCEIQAKGYTARMNWRF